VRRASGTLLAYTYSRPFTSVNTLFIAVTKRIASFAITKNKNAVTFGFS